LFFVFGRPVEQRIETNRNMHQNVILVLRRILEPKRDGVTSKWRRLRNEELYAVYPSTNVILVTKNTEMGRACGTYG
jgi:hypothetical protein